ncbi:anti-sigma-D factor RsdA [Mycobacterium sp. B14F4]|uniref:anti-sigma-D factor RsdA n=1 Tax=Mycobacterium sp. B14F4 TaxID=3153565 RepID=UPI00325C62EB
MPDFGRWTSNGGDPSLNEVNRTDRFLDSLAFELPVYSTDPGEAELAHMLAGWRDEVRDAPLTAALTPRDAVLALDRATMSRRRTRASLAVVGSVAAAVLSIGGFGAVVAGAGPGDALYGLRTMLFGEQQSLRDDAVVLAAQTQMAEVQQLIDQGQWEAAQDKLETLTTTVATVDDGERKEELVSQWQELTVKVEAKDAQATIPPDAPLPQLPAIVAPESDASATSSDITSPGAETTSSAEVPPTSVPPTPSSPLPSPSSPLPSPSTPLPTPLPTTQTPVPTPSPLPTPTAVPPLPTSTIVVPTRVPLPTPPEPPSEVADVPPAAEEPPVLQAPPVVQAPQTVITTTVLVPEPDNAPRGQESE